MGELLKIITNLLLVGGLGLHVERVVMAMALQPSLMTSESEILDTVLEENENTPPTPVVVVVTYFPPH